MNFLLNRRYGIEYYTIPSFQDTGLVKHLFTTRIGGVSPEPFNNLNLGRKTGDSAENLEENFERISKVLDSSIESFVFSNQVHGTNIEIVKGKDKEVNTDKSLDEAGVDGLLTDLPGLVLCTFYADCVPIFYLDKVKKVVGLAHGGWRGTVDKIAGKMVDKMVEHYSSKPEDIIVGIAPSIGSCCYEVGNDVYEKFNKNFTKVENMMKPISEGRWQLDLWEANKMALKEKGILCRNITISGICTSCNSQEFFSYRKDNGRTGRMAAIIQLI